MVLTALIIICYGQVARLSRRKGCLHTHSRPFLMGKAEPNLTSYSLFYRPTPHLLLCRSTSIPSVAHSTCLLITQAANHDAATAHSPAAVSLSLIKHTSRSSIPRCCPLWTVRRETRLLDLSRSECTALGKLLGANWTPSYCSLDSSHHFNPEFLRPCVGQAGQALRSIDTGAYPH
jgi:hypothetical protein